MRRERGAAIVETAILIPFLALLVLGITDLGRALSAQISLQDAVSEGALYGSQFPDDYSLLRQRVMDASTDLSLGAGDVIVTCPTPKQIVVTADHQVDMITFVGQWFGSTLDLQASSTGTVVTSATCQPSP